MLDSLKKVAVWSVLLCFIAVFDPASALAKNDDGRYYRHGHNKPGYHHRNGRGRDRDRFVIGRLHIRQNHLDYTRRSRFTFNDLITASIIADKTGRLDTGDVLRMRFHGRSYKSIAKQYGVNWNGVEREVKKVHREMERAARPKGLVLWALHDLL